MDTRKRTYFTIAASLALYVLLEALCFAAVQLVRVMSPVNYGYIAPFGLSRESRSAVEKLVEGDPGYLQPDTDLGWTIRPNSAQRGIYRSNSQGLRAERDLSPEPEPGKIRAAAFGDSFTHGDDVPYKDTWQQAIEKKDDRFEVLNFGVGGYGLDQAYLRYRSNGKPYHPKVVLIGFMSENIRRHVNDFRPFYTQSSGFIFAKPRFKIREGRLELLPNPLPDRADYRALLDDEDAALARLGKDDYYYQRYHRYRWMGLTPLMQAFRLAGNLISESMPGPRPIIRGYTTYNRQSEAYQITLALLESFHKEAAADGSKPLIVLFPDRRDLQKIRKGKMPIYQPLIDDLKIRGYDFVDVLEAFRAHPGAAMGDLYGPERHYTAFGNALAGELILERLKTVIT